jgi:putative DNA modification/repair radical SAM protein
MPNIIVRNAMTYEEAVSQMRSDARYDVSDNDGACVPDHSAISSIASQPAPPKVPKVFLSNDCVFNCAYCGCRSTLDGKRRYTHAPRELARIAVSEAAQNGRGIFITSAIRKNADYTQELIVETLRAVRNELGYGGYVHAKVMPGTDPALIRETGKYADRLSVNIEVAKSEGYRRVARQKNKDNILTPMRHISELIAEAGETGGRRRPRFATSQTTQLMAGSAEEDDRTILRLSRALYDKYKLKRVYYTAFRYEQEARGYDLPLTVTPFWRMSRLYQADRLMQLYGFTPEEIAPEWAPWLEQDIDPKTVWALRNLHLFPVEVNTADYDMLLRVPGIGVTYARRILEARKYCAVTFDILRRIGVPLKRSRHFITCGGRMERGVRLDSPHLRGILADGKDMEQVEMEFCTRSAGICK